MARPRISQKLGILGLVFMIPGVPLFARLNQQEAQQSDPPFGIGSMFSSQLDFVQLAAGVRQSRQAGTMGQITTKGSSCPACQLRLYRSVRLRVALGHVHLRKAQRLLRHRDMVPVPLEFGHFGSPHSVGCRRTAGPDHSGFTQNLRVEPVQGLPHRLPAESFTGAFP